MVESREQIAQREVGHTDITPWLSRMMAAVFLATIIVVPSLQVAYDIRQSRTGEPGRSLAPVGAWWEPGRTAAQ